MVAFNFNFALQAGGAEVFVAGYGSVSLGFNYRTDSAEMYLPNSGI
jgi:hypothetical protein